MQKPEESNRKTGTCPRCGAEDFAIEMTSKFGFSKPEIICRQCGLVCGDVYFYDTKE
jgi:hypothetical protein